MRIDQSRSLKNRFPEIAKEWNKKLNENLTPSDVTYGSSKKVWWQCPKNENHIYKAVISERTRKDGRGTGCPFCRGNNKLTPERSLAIRYPEVANFWHPTLNHPLTPNDVFYGSKKEFWWQCPISDDHFWDARVNDLTSGQRCPFCAGKRVSKTNSLFNLFPKIAEEWHPTLNDSLTPQDVPYGSDKEVWWRCSKDETHQWKKKIKARTLDKGKDCPFCNSIAFKFPEIAKEFHPDLNYPLNPNEIPYASNQKIWWQCPKFENHKYQATVDSRTRNDGTGTGCPFCSNQSSRPEIRILSELETIFKNVISRQRIKGKEIDIYLPDLKIGIEYDGYYFHKNSFDSDKRKNKLLCSEKIFLIRFREKPLKKIQENDILISDDLKKSDIDKLLTIISNYQILDEKFLIKNVEAYKKFDNFTNNSVFKEYLNCFPSPLPQNSLSETHPEIAIQWHKEKNKPLKPSNFSYGSNIKVWWQCDKFQEHSWEATITSRTGKNKTGCPHCYRQLDSN